MHEVPLDRRAVVICPVIPEPPISGAHKRTLRLLEAMEAEGAHPHLLTVDKNADGAARLRDRGWVVDVLSAPPPRLALRARQHLRRLPSPYLTAVDERLMSLVREGCAFVQVEHTQSAYYDAALAGAPSLLSLHNVDSSMHRSVARRRIPLTPSWARDWNRWHSIRFVERRALERADTVMCVSELDAEVFRARSGSVIVVPNGVDDEFFQIDPELPGEERVFFFGHFGYAPNLHAMTRFLGEGWPLLAAARPRARLALAGAGMPRSLARLAAGSERVEVLGVVPDMAVELAASRLVIVPMWEGGGTRLKVLESLASARPLVGTSLGVEGIDFHPGRHGLVAEQPAELAEAAAGLLEDLPHSLALGLEGRRLAERYRWRLATEPARAVYRRWLDEAARRRAVAAPS